MNNYDYESKLLHLNIKENEEKYISGELPLDEPLKKTEELYDQAFEAAKKNTVSKFSNDSGLMQLQSKIVRQRAKSYKPDTLVFDSRDFSEKLKRHFIKAISSDGKNKKLSHHQYSMIWQKLGEESQKKMHITPTFDFIYGTFSAVPASPVKKKRKRVEKDKLANAVKPNSVDISESSDGKDVMISRAERAINILKSYIKKSEKKSVCFYEFVIDPKSFTRTIENIFTLTLILQNGLEGICIVPDEQGLPWLKILSEAERREKQTDTSGRMQSVLSMSIEEWQTIIRKCNFTKALIPVKSEIIAAQKK